MDSGLRFTIAFGDSVICGRGTPHRDPGALGSGKRRGGAGVAGRRRLAAPEARLQYHNVRIVGVDGLTGATATKLGRGLTEVDSGITALLVQRARQGGGVDGNGDAAASATSHQATGRRSGA